MVIIGVFLSYAFFYGPSEYTTDSYTYTALSMSVYNGNIASLPYNGVIGQKYIMNVGISLFYYIFGRTIFASTVFGELCFIGTIILLFFFGKKLSGNISGIMAAATYAVMPIAVTGASTVGDAVPMAFLATMAMYATYAAYTSKGKNSSFILIFFASFVTSLGFLITAEQLIMLLPIFAVVSYSALRKRDYVLPMGFIVGIAMGVMLIMLFNVALGASPILQFSLDSSWYSQSIWYGTPLSNTFSTYINSIFPVFYSGNSSIASYLLPSYGHVPHRMQDFQYSWLAYLAIAGAILAFAMGDRKISLPAVWFSITLVYLIFGTMSIHKYILIAPQLRYSLILAPALALMVGLGAESLSRAKRHSKAFLYAFIAIFLLLALQASYSIYFVGMSEYASFYPLMQGISFVNGLSNASFATSYDLIRIGLYSNAKPAYFNGLYPNCTTAASVDFIITESNSSFAEECGLRVAAGPFVIPPRLKKFNLLEYDGIVHAYGNENISVYSKG
ncbi:glycosyltransferase family 39 protein [Candidatus Marsarchaeota archaeon]|nr:glycosyltransferase family 39 protein [Candidatus Marsarchaeota archaeon]